jgi:hypothetical protein
MYLLLDASRTGLVSRHWLRRSAQDLAATPLLSLPSDSRITRNMQADNFTPPWRCYCGKAYQVQTSLQRHSRTCPAVSEDCKSLLQLLACLEPQPVPGDVLFRVFHPFRVWNENGNEAFERSFQYPLVFESQDRLDKAIQDAVNSSALLVTIGSTTPEDEGPWWAYRDFALPGTSQAFIQSDLALQQARSQRELEALRLILHYFPIPNLDTK